MRLYRLSKFLTHIRLLTRSFDSMFSISLPLSRWRYITSDRRIFRLFLSHFIPLYIPYCCQYNFLRSILGRFEFILYLICSNTFSLRSILSCSCASYLLRISGVICCRQQTLLQEDTALTCSCVGVTNVIIPYPPSMITAEVTANPVYRRRDISHTLITETKLQMILLQIYPHS